MSTGQTFYISSKILVLDIEADTTVYNNKSITELCVTDIFGNVLIDEKLITKDTIDKVHQTLKHKVVVAFDSIQDYNFLLKECEHQSINLGNINWFCAKKFLEGHFNTEQLSLKKACEISKLKYPKHTAKDDCLCLARVIRKVIKKMPEEFSKEYINLTLAILQAFKESGVDHLPLGDNLPLDTLIREVEDGTALGRQYLELFRNKVLDELTLRGAFSTNVDILKRGDSENNVT